MLVRSARGVSGASGSVALSTGTDPVKADSPTCQVDLTSRKSAGIPRGQQYQITWHQPWEGMLTFHRYDDCCFSGDRLGQGSDRALGLLIPASQ